MTVHNAQVKHLDRNSGGWIRWAAACPCGYFEKESPTTPAAELAVEHNEKHGVYDAGGDLALSCTCYDPRSMDHAPEPCDYCQRLDREGLA